MRLGLLRRARRVTSDAGGRHGSDPRFGMYELLLDARLGAIPYETALQRLASMEDAPPDPNLAGRLQAAVLWVASRRDEAVARLRALSDRDPDDAAAHCQIGSYLACLDQPHEALREFEAAANVESYPCAFHAASAYGAARRAGNTARNRADRASTRINAEVAKAELQLANDGEKLAQASQIIDFALDLAKDCAASYRKTQPDVRKMWNRAFFNTMRIRDGTIADFTHEEPFASLLGSHKGSMVDPRGFEPLTFWLPARRSTS
jgi:hypothetical protein